MEQYISPAVASVIRVCVDEYHESGWQGRIYTRLQESGISFRNMEEMLHISGTIWDAIGFPQESTIGREFTERHEHQSKFSNKVEFKIAYPNDGKRDKIKVEVSEEDMDKKNGEQGTFIVRIRYRQNATWQGHVTWVEENKTVPFRSALELIRLIDSTQDEVEEWNDEK